MIKLKDILLETYAPLVEAPTKDKKDKTDPKKEKILKQIIPYKDDKGKDQEVSVKTASENPDHPQHKKAKAMLKGDKEKTTDKSKEPSKKPEDDKPKSKKDQEKAQKASEKKERKELEKIKKAKVVVKTPGKADKEISIEDILPHPFGNAKDDSHPQADDAKQKVYQLYKDRYGKEGKAERKKRLKNTDKNGDPILSKEEQALYDKQVEEAKEYNEENKKEIAKNPALKEDIPTKKDFLTEKIKQDYKDKANYYDPEGPDYGNKNNYWTKKEAGDDSGPWGDLGDDDEDWDMDDEKSVDAYGEKLSSKRGGKEQQQAMELKLRVPVGNLKKIKQEKNHYVENEDGNKVPVTVFQDPKTKKYHAVDDEGNIYEGETADFRKAKPTGDLGGYPGGQTKTGKKISDKRMGKDDDDDYETTTFADLLSMLSFGASDDIDWSDPVN